VLCSPSSPSFSSSSASRQLGRPVFFSLDRQFKTFCPFSPSPATVSYASFFFITPAGDHNQVRVIVFSFIQEGKRRFPRGLFQFRFIKGLRLLFSFFGQSESDPPSFLFSPFSEHVAEGGASTLFTFSFGPEIKKMLIPF